MTARLFSRRNPAVEFRGIHLDLKGNPPTPKRLLELLDLCAALKLNVVLAEWEDTFPWRDRGMRSPTVYSPGTIREFVRRADELEIRVVSLVQCLGHAETALKGTKYRSLREIPDNFAEFCPSNPKSAAMVIGMIDEVLELTGGGSGWFHLGGDEAWHMGTCPRCRRMAKKIGRGGLYLNHVGPILDHLKRYRLRPILWDDMMRHWPAGTLKKLAARADLMSWTYSTPAGWRRGPNEEHLRTFRRNGVVVWAGSAYKGAEALDADVPDVAARNRNNLAWVRMCSRHGLKGMVATAWSRFNTMVIPCETIDASLDALVLSAAAMWDGSLPADFRAAARAALKRHRGGIELKRFERCHAAAKALADWRGWYGWHLGEAEQAAHVVEEPEKLNPFIVKTRAKRLREGLKKGKKLAENFVRAHKGLIPDFWLKRYADSRIRPLEKRFRTI